MGDAHAGASRLTAEIAALKENKGDFGRRHQQKARLSGPTAEAAPAPPQGLSRTEAYARYHDAEAALRAGDKTASLEASLAKLMGELQQKLPVYQERSSRLAAVVASHAEVSTRLGAAVRARDAATKAAEELKVEVAALRATRDELTQKHGVDGSVVELSEKLKIEQLGAASRVAEAERPLKAALQAAEEKTGEADAQRAAAKAEVETLKSQVDRWRVLYEARVASLPTDEPPPPGSEAAAVAASVAEVRALLEGGVSAAALQKAKEEAKKLPAAKDDGAAAAALQAKVDAAEAQAEKLPQGGAALEEAGRGGGEEGESASGGACCTRAGGGGGY